jgi:hypothetical protein
MLRFTLIFSLLLSNLFTVFIAHAQQDTLKYWIQFNDKNDSPFSVENPNEFLSQRAIDRRLKNNIAITEQDLPVNPQYIDSLLTFNTVSLINSSRWFNAITVSCHDTLAIQAIAQLSFVTQTQVVQRLSLSPIDADFEEILLAPTKSSVNISNEAFYPYGLAYNQNHLHKIDYLHQMGFQGSGKHIAVIDSGFRFVFGMKCFSHLFHEGRILSTKDFVDHDGDVYWDHHHGTIVLSTMAAYLPGEYCGTAVKASYHLLRSEAVAYEHIIEEDNWVSAAEYADSAGVDIINTSLGYTRFDDSTQNHTYADLDGNTTRIAQAANIAASKGILVVNSAGNYGSGDWQYIGTPADARDVLAVGAVDSLGNRAPFSSVGPNSNGDIKPNVASVGWFTYVITPFGEDIVKANGTSFSSPMVAGMAACLWETLPDYSNFEIKALIEQSSHQYQTPDSLLGYGIPDVHKAYQTATGQSYPLQEGIELLAHYPNPSSADFYIHLRSDRSQNIKFTFHNYTGELLHESSLEIEEGLNKITMRDFDAVQGVFFLGISDETGKAITVRVVRV